jgi:hypothetical protein
MSDRHDGLTIVRNSNSPFFAPDGGCSALLLASSGPHLKISNYKSIPKVVLLETSSRLEGRPSEASS